MQVLVFVVLCIISVYSAALTGRALYCRDPDTGKLHAVNTTWPSSTFCGNYTCKLRRINITETEYTPIRQLNVTIHDHSSDKNKNITIQKTIEPDIIPLPPKNWNPQPTNIIDNDVTKIEPKYIDVKDNSENKQYYEPKTSQTLNDIGISKLQDQGDRYLTENEINSIANVLHTVRKSDLDAIVDIYNLAQDIYKEMDKVTDEQAVDEALELIREQEKHKKPQMLKPHSYWYHPFGNKGKMADRYDSEHQGTQQVHTTVKPKVNVPTYFNGPLTRNDFGKLPYYYPVTDFQRMSSYTHQPFRSSQLQRDSSVNKKSCKTHDKHQEPVSQKLIEPSLLLPYPFASVHHYNISEYPGSFYYKLHPYAIDYYNRYKYYQPYYNVYKQYIAPIPKAILVNPHLSNEVQDEEQKPVKHIKDNTESKHTNIVAKTENMPKWKTGPIPLEVLKDIRANVDTSKFIKAFPLRKRVKLDRVGKLIRMDDVNNSNERCKRSPDKSNDADNDTAGNLEQYETYLEKVTCRTLTVPGFFRMGNLTHPYPHCCPQKIETS